jgi:hypothetical protein
MDQLLHSLRASYMEDVGVDINELGMLKSSAENPTYVTKFNQPRDKSTEKLICDHIKSTLLRSNDIHIKVIYIPKNKTNTNTDILYVLFSYEVRGEFQLKRTEPFDFFHSPFSNSKLTWEHDLNEWFAEFNVFLYQHGIDWEKISEPDVHEDTGLYTITIKSNHISSDIENIIETIFE